MPVRGPDRRLRGLTTRDNDNSPAGADQALRLIAQHDELPGEEGVRHRVVIDQVTHRLHHLFLAEYRMTVIRGHVDDGAFRIPVHLEVGVTGNALDLVRRQVAGGAEEFRHLAGRRAILRGDLADDVLGRRKGKKESIISSIQRELEMRERLAALTDADWKIKHDGQEKRVEIGAVFWVHTRDMK